MKNANTIHLYKSVIASPVFLGPAPTLKSGSNSTSIKKTIFLNFFVRTVCPIILDPIYIINYYVNVSRLI